MPNLESGQKRNIEGGEFDPVLWIEFGVAQWSERLVRRTKDPVRSNEDNIGSLRLWQKSKGPLRAAQLHYMQTNEPESSVLAKRRQKIRDHFQQGSVRRIDIIAIKNNSAYILDPTIRFETHADQPHEVDSEKKRIYEQTIPFYKDKYSLSHIDVIGLMVGARVRPVYVIDVYKLTPSNGPKERSRRARDLTVASDNLSAIEFRPGDFFFNVEPVIRNEATHRKIVFRVGILA
ncbi:hypothetical protein ANN_16295 [Periplaneta americana]|uniref:Uncharacterized protein n=1 Tax=Periplaneta americana TaxID=6978 RepID=A0ABQ8SIM6_PERAM|nr:hypothetical protein ANN_16295 [Periplaneta americana]